MCKLRKSAVDTRHPVCYILDNEKKGGICMNRDEFLFFLYAIDELLSSKNFEGAERVVKKAIKQSERKDSSCSPCV